MPTISDPINYHELLTSYLPHGVFYVVKDFKQWGFAGILEEHLPLKKKDLDEIRDWNNKGYDVFWTANAAKEEQGNRTHEDKNLAWVNACYTELDIEETKECVFIEDFEKREKKKAELAGHIFMREPAPSLVIESRNSFHLYWFTTCELPIFQKIQEGLYQAWKDLGADPAVKNPLRLLRVPGFYNHKNGEKFKCDIRLELCARYDDGSFKHYSPDELLEAFPVASTQIQVMSTTAFNSSQKPAMFRNNNDIFRKVVAMPILEVFRRINGTKLVGGEILEFTPEKNGKVQIKSNGKATPNFISIKDNLVFSNNIKGHASVFHYCMYYGFNKAELASEFKLLFPMT